MPGIPARFWPAALGWLALAACALPSGLTPVRVVVAGGFLLVGPGAAIVRLTHPGREEADRMTRLLTAAVYSVAFSVAVDTLLAEAFFFTRSLSTTRAVAALALLTTLLAAWPAHRPRAPRVSRESGRLARALGRPHR